MAAAFGSPEMSANFAPGGSVGGTGPHVTCFGVIILWALAAGAGGGAAAGGGVGAAVGAFGAGAGAGVFGAWAPAIAASDSVSAPASRVVFRVVMYPSSL